MPRKSVPANPTADYTLTEDNGPWLILASSFKGEEAAEQAHELALELRRDYNLPAYYFDMTFKLDDANPGRGIDHYGGKIKRRYRQGDKVVEHAVLVGEFPAIDDPEGQRPAATHQGDAAEDAGSEKTRTTRPRAWPRSERCNAK